MHYNCEVIQAIMKAVGKSSKEPDPKSLAADLEHAARAFQISQLWHKSPSRDRRIESLKRIEHHCRIICNEVGVFGGTDSRDTKPFIFATLSRHAHDYADKHGAYPEFEPTLFEPDVGEEYMDYKADLAVSRALEGVWLLYRWAKAAREEAEDPSTNFLELEGPSAEVWLICKRLPAIYERHFGQPFGVSKAWKSKGPPYGPGIRFIQACLAPLGIKKSPDAIEKSWDRYRRKWDIESKI